MFMGELMAVDYNELNYEDKLRAWGMIKDLGLVFRSKNPAEVPTLKVEKPNGLPHYEVISNQKGEYYIGEQGLLQRVGNIFSRKGRWSLVAGYHDSTEVRASRKNNGVLEVLCLKIDDNN